MMSFKQICRKTALITAIQMAVAVGLSYTIATHVAILLHFSDPLLSGLWACISSIVVMQVQVKDVHQAGWIRLLGSLLGGISAVVMVTLFGYSLMTILLTMFLTTILMSLLDLKMAVRLANLTALIIILVGITEPTIPVWNNALARVLESALGITITILLVWICHPIRKKFDLFQRY